MKYTAPGESREASAIFVTRFTECYICSETLTKSCILSYKQSDSALSVLLYFKLNDVLTGNIPLKYNTKQMCFFDKNV